MADHVKRAPFSEALTLRQLRDRLTELLEKAPSTADQRVVFRVEQEDTPSGRHREDIFLPVRFACGGTRGIHTEAGEHFLCTELRIPIVPREKK